MAGTRGFSGFRMEDLLFGPSTSKESLPAENVTRGRPRKVAVIGEEQRRRQMTKRKKNKNLTAVRPFKASRNVFLGEQVNTTKMYLPNGWKCFATKRSSGIHKGLFDLVYLSPTGDRIRSRNEVYRWIKKNQSDLDPLQFLFTRSLQVLLAKENAEFIIFRNAGLKGKTLRYMEKYINPDSSTGDCNTIFTESGRALMEANNDSDLCVHEPGSSNQGGTEEVEPILSKEGSTDTPKKKKVVKKTRIPLEKTLNCLKSPYFALKNQIPVKPVSIHAIHSSKWIPPRSPYNLIQEDLYHDPWQLLIATIFLNCTTGKLAIPVIHEFLARWPSPHEACSASLFDILDVVELLGLGRTRAATIIRFSHEYLTVDWKKPTELFGIGKYGNDSYRVFCLGQWKTVESDDKYLNLYINWLHNSYHNSFNALNVSRGKTNVSK